MDDDAAVLTLEALLAAFILVGATVVVVAVPPQPSDAPAVARHLQQDAQDALLALDAQRVGGASLLEMEIAQGAACKGAAPPSRCPSAASAARLASYLPPGTSYRLLLSNGAAQAELYAPRGAPASEAAAASILVSPTWNFSLALTSLSCQDPAQRVEVRAVALRNGVVQPVRHVDLTAGAATLAAAPVGEGVWNATLAPAVWTTASRVDAFSTHRGEGFAGEARLATCLLGSLGGDLSRALANSSFTAGSAPPGGDIPWSYDVRPLLAAAPAIRLDHVTLDVHQPAPPAQGPLPPVAERIEPGARAAASGSWRVPADSFLGVHPAILRIGLTLENAGGSVAVEARLLALPTVTLPDGRAPADPLYRVSLQVWQEGP